MWNADNGDGTYSNPILYTDYSDPDVCRVGDDYFMVASSFCNVPGIPVLHSKDLVNWKVINYAIKRIPGDSYDKPRHGCGVWAPAIRFHADEFIIFFPMPDEGIYVVKSKDPWGEWSEPVQLYKGKGWIDPCPFWDDDGKAYMVSAFAKSRIGFKSILNLCEITPDCTRIIDKGKYIFDGNTTAQETIEGPKMYKRNEYYYIFAPAGGVKQGWQTVLRSKDIWGPYEYRVVMEQMDSEVNGPHQGAWVETQTNEDWFVHFQDVYAAGRIVHLQPMSWEDDWPVIGEAKAGDICGKPVMKYRKPDTGVINGQEIFSPDAEDDFEKDELGLQWQWNANYKNEWYKIDTLNKVLELNSIYKDDNTSISDMPNLLLQKWCMPEFALEIKLLLDEMQTGDCAGVISMGITYGAVAVLKCKDGFSLEKIYGNQKFSNEIATATDIHETLAMLPPECRTIYIRNVVRSCSSETYNTDGKYRFPIPVSEISFEYSIDGKYYVKCHSYMAEAGRWVGVKNGMFCYNSDNNNKNPGKVKVEYYHFVDSMV